MLAGFSPVQPRVVLQVFYSCDFPDYMHNLALLICFVEVDPEIQDLVFDNLVLDQISFDMEQAYYKREVLLVDSYYYSYFVLAIVGVKDCHKDWFWQNVLICPIFWLVISSILPVILVLQIPQ